MTSLIFHHDAAMLPPASEAVMPVQLYGLDGKQRRGVSVIGNPVVEKIRRLGVQIPPQAIDFLSIALAVTAADTFVRRSDAADGWSRQLMIQLPLCEPQRWNAVKTQLAKALHFLSGDMWAFEFTDEGYAPPAPYGGRYKLTDLNGLDCVCLFSGGLDSAIGAIDLLAAGRSPLLVSHAYKGDKARQEKIATSLQGRFSQFAVNAHPLSAGGKTDITMRTRSCNFLAFGAVGASAVQAVNQQEHIELLVPENGFISLNAPLTARRIGTLSTRTTHPYFIGLIQDIFDNTAIPCAIRNPYQFKTKGEMALDCAEGQLLEQIVDDTVSCSHWKRKHIQCGICVPCLIRRSALYAADIQEQTGYAFNTVTDVLNEMDKRDDLFALSIAIASRESRNLSAWIADSGPLLADELEEYKNAFSRGLEEVRLYLDACGAL